MIQLLAYLDPSTGSMAWQIAISSLLAGAATCRLYWSKLKSIFRTRQDGGASRQRL